MAISSISKDSSIPLYKVNDFSELAGKEQPAGESDTNNFKHLFNQIVSTENAEVIKDVTSPIALKRIQDLMDIELLDMMDEDYEDKPSSISILSSIRPSISEPQAVLNTPDLSEASKIQRTTNENDVLPSKSNLDTVIEKAAKIHDIDPDLIKSVIQAESNFHPESISSAGAMGLMQLMPGTAKDLGIKNAYDPEENIMGGTKYLKGLLNRYGGNMSRALAAYNWGAGNVEKNPDKMPLETRNYISKVTQFYRDTKA